MNPDRIDFISSYCDRWCERCAFTSRCALFEVQVAIGMCGNVEEGIELAVGAPHPEGQYANPIEPPDWVTEFESDEMTPAESADFRSLRARV